MKTFQILFLLLALFQTNHSFAYSDTTEKHTADDASTAKKLAVHEAKVVCAGTGQRASIDKSIIDGNSAQVTYTCRGIAKAKHFDHISGDDFNLFFDSKLRALWQTRKLAISTCQDNGMRFGGKVSSVCLQDAESQYYCNYGFYCK